jgi:hypothetical protein
MILKRLLDHIKRTVRVCHSFDCGHIGAFGLMRQHCAAFDGFTIHMDNTRTALASIATNMRTCQPLAVTQKLDQQRAAFDLTGPGLAINRHHDLTHNFSPLVTQ